MRVWHLLLAVTYGARDETEGVRNNGATTTYYFCPSSSTIIHGRPPGSRGRAQLSGRLPFLQQCQWPPALASAGVR
jgi:hypothetical protein